MDAIKNRYIDDKDKEMSPVHQGVPQISGQIV